MFMTKFKFDDKNITALTVQIHYNPLNNPHFLLRGKLGQLSKKMRVLLLVYHCSLFMKKELSLSCKASRKALLPRLPITDVRMRLSAVQLTNLRVLSTTGS